MERYYLRTMSVLLISFNINLGLIAKNIDEDFKFELQVSDILSWQNGDGAPQDTQRSMAKALEREIKAAKKSLEFATYGVYKQSWLIELLEKLPKSMKLRAVVDQVKGTVGDWNPDYFNYRHTPNFANAIGLNNIKVDTGRDPQKPRASIMHNKYIVFDEKKVWLGSANLSNNCIGDEYNSNSSIFIESKSLAEIYLKEFDQMFVDGRFSTAKFKLENIEQSLTYRDGTTVDVYFSPQDNPILTAVVPLLKSAKKSIDVGMFFLTDMRAADSLIKAHKRGVKVRVIQDAVAASIGTSLHKHLRRNGVPVRIENWGGKMHMKTAIIDGQKVLMGSMNWSEAGTSRNDENTVIIKNKNVAKQLTDYFEKLWESLSFYDYMDPNHIVDPRPEGAFSINSCFDGIDNNYNNLIDRLDPECR